MKDLDSMNKFSELRQRAKQAATRKSLDISDVSTLSPEEAAQLIHELQVHQIELEVQNEDLRQAQIKVEESRDRYADLYDFAPLGYLTLNDKGLILEANLRAAQLLDIDRKDLLKQPFSGFVYKEHADVWHFHLREVFQSRSPQMIETRLVRRDGSLFHAQVESIAGKDEEEQVSQCRMVISDITERKKGEDELRESEALYRNLVENVEDLVCKHDLQGNLIFANASSANLLGYGHADLVGTNLRSYLVPERRDQFDAYLAAVQRDGSASGLMLIRTNTGEKRIWEYHNSLVMEGVADPIVLGIARDVTDRRRAEEELRESEQRYRAVVDNVEIGISLLNADMEIVDVNRAFKEYFPHVRPGCGQICYEQFNDPPRQALCSYCPCVLTLQDGKVHEAVTETPAGSKIRYYHLVSSPIMDSDGRVQYVIELTEDITDRKKAKEALQESEERYRALFETAGDAIYILEAEGERAGQIVDANWAAAEMHGYTRDELVTLKISDLDTPESAEKVSERIERLLSEGRLREEVTHRRKDGAVFPMEINSRLVGLGGQRRILAIGRDITNRKRAEEALRLSEARYRLLFEQAPLMYVITRNNQGMPFVNDCNEFFCHSLGYTREEVVGRPLADFYSPESRAALLGGGGYARALAGEFFIGERHLETRDGRLIPTLLHTATEVDPSGRVTGTRAMFVEITDRKRTEEALRESEERFKQVAENAGEWIWEVDANGMYRYCSSAVERILGYSPDELVGKKYFYDLFPPEVREDRKKESLGIFERKETFRAFVNSNLHRDGSIVILETSGSPVQDEQGTLLGYRGTDMDVTERKRAEEALSESEERLRLFIEHAPTALAMFDPEMRYLAANRPWMKEYRLDDRPIIGRSHYKSSRWIPDRWKAVHRRALEGEIVKADEDLIELKSGATQWRRWEARPWYTAEGSIGGIVIFAEDITERKQAEEALLRSERKYRTLFDESRDGILSVLRDGRITDANPSFLELFGYTRKEMIGKDVREMYVDPADRLIFQEEIEKKGFVKDYEIRFRKKDGTEVDGLITASVQYGDDGSIVGYRGIIRDLTIRKRLQNQLFQAQKMEAIGTLAGGIAHDFNNLLQIIMGYSDMLIAEKDKGSPDLRKLETIRKATEDGRELVKGLLTFSRQAQSTKVSVDLAQQLNHLRTILRRMIPWTIEIEIILADELTTVNADPIQLEQVLMNLAVNAHHAMPNGGKFTIEAQRITLDEDYCRANAEAKPGEYIMLKISDTGHGMEKEVLKRIFEPFYTTKEVGVGTGLGLSVVYGIVKNNDGRITCSSEPGQGTTFNIYFPAGPGECEPDVATTSEEMPVFGTEAILVVDDESRIRSVVAEILRPFGYIVFTAENGYEALEIYREKKDEIDLVILDLNMPRMGGKECFDKILKIDPEARVLIASGHSVDESIKKLLGFRASGFIGKPFDARELFRALRRVLDEPGSLRSPVRASGTVSTRIAEGEGTLATAPSSLAGSVPAHEGPHNVELPWRLRILAIDDREPYLRMLEAGLAQFEQTPLTASSGIEGLQVFRETPVDVVVCDQGMPELDGWEVARRVKEICRGKEIPKTLFILLTGQADMEDPDQETRSLSQNALHFCEGAV